MLRTTPTSGPPRRSPGRGSLSCTDAYGYLKGTPYKWLDLSALCSVLLPQDEVRKAMTLRPQLKHLTPFGGASHTAVQEHHRRAAAPLDDLDHGPRRGVERRHAGGRAIHSVALGVHAAAGYRLPPAPAPAIN